MVTITVLAQEVAIEIVENNKNKIIVPNKFDVVKSEKLTDSILDLNRIGYIAFVESKDEEVKEEEVIQSVTIEEAPRRRRRSKSVELDNNRNSSEDNTEVEVESEDTISPEDESQPTKEV